MTIAVGDSHEELAVATEDDGGHSVWLCTPTLTMQANCRSSCGKSRLLVDSLHRGALPMTSQLDPVGRDENDGGAQHLGEFPSCNSDELVSEFTERSRA